jgi:chromosomal replication initiation ATPase DnaA
MRMQYQPMAAKEYETTRELRAGYNQIHRKFFDKEALEITQQCNRDHQMIASLRERVERQLAETRRLIEETRTNQLRIDELRAQIIEGEATASRLEERRKELEAVNTIGTTIVTFRQVLAAACDVYRVAPQVVKSASKDSRAVAARRHIVHILTSRRADLSISLIGRLLCRDHTTILHARNSWMRASMKLAAEISAMDRLLGISPAVDSAYKVKTNHPREDDLGTD